MCRIYAIAIELVLKEIKQIENIKSVSICYVERHDVIREFSERCDFSTIEQDEFDDTIVGSDYA